MRSPSSDPDRMSKCGACRRLPEHTVSRSLLPSSLTDPRVWAIEAALRPPYRAATSVGELRPRRKGSTADSGPPAWFREVFPLPITSLQWITLWVCLGAPPSTTADTSRDRRTDGRSRGYFPRPSPPSWRRKSPRSTPHIERCSASPSSSGGSSRSGSSYEALLGRTTDPDAQAAIRARLERVRRHADAAEAARTFQAILERSRRRDREVAAIRSRLSDRRTPTGPAV